MNKSKNSKRWNWKVATFLPLLVFLLMAFGRKGENPPEIVNLPVENPLENIVSSAETEQNQYDEFKQKIEIRKDGNYINNKQVSLEEIKDQDRKWRDASNASILLLVDESMPHKRVDEVRQSLKGYYWVVQATVNSDELIYFFGDVNKAAKFKNGNWSEWIRKQLDDYPEAKSLSESKSFKLTYGFIIGKNGKVRDGHVIQECEYPEINEAYNEILTQIPDWEPAMGGNESISVYCRYMTGHKIAEAK
jgi:biopolymer transport protein ExbD